MTDIRLDALRAWLSETYSTTIDTLEPASSDASFRRYFRVTFHDLGELSSLDSQKSYIVMDAPPEKEDTTAFETIDDWLFSLGVHVPQILARDHEQGFLLLEDLGNQTLLPALNNDTVDDYYQQTITSLIHMQHQAKLSPIKLPDYDRTRLLNEMELFREWYLPKLLNYQPSADENAMLDKVFSHLIDSALDQPTVFVHRDFHSRNLMLTEKNSPGIIDFQDGVWGPITYDLVSLLRDVYVEWPEQKVYQWVESYYQSAVETGLLEGVTQEQFIRWFDLMGLQRHIKIAGIFTRLYYRDGKENYLPDIPLTLKYIYSVARRYDEFEGLVSFLDKVTKQQESYV